MTILEVNRNPAEEALMNTECVTEHRSDLDDGPFWPAVQWGAAGIALIGLLLFLPAAAWLLTLA
jgi:hypothetical protein